MAVLKNKRKEGQLKVITLGDELTVYTLRMLCNESFFPKKSRWLLAGKIADLMNEFHQNLHVGNDIFVATEEDAHERHLRQTRAYSTLYASASVMRTACDALDISPDKFETWAGMCVEELRLLKAWQKNDDQRYSIR